MSDQFNKSKELFPSKERGIFFSYCSVSPLNSVCLQAMREFDAEQSAAGIHVFEKFPALQAGMHRAFASLLKTSPDNISMTSNTAEGLNFIANGYPFKEGDQVISYVHEYPANHYPWVLQAKRRGVEFIALSNAAEVDTAGNELPGGWSMDELLRLVTPKTRIIALSHVQFASGYRADLTSLGELCRGKGIDLVLDVAQSLGVHPVYPELNGVAAVAGCGWKWLMGPVGSGVLYTSPEFREKLQLTMVGADHMKQMTDYLDHSWNPFEDGRRFEYSTLPASYALALERSLNEIFLPYGAEAIEKEVFRLQQRVLGAIDRRKYRPIVFEENNRSGILSFVCQNDLRSILKELRSKNITLTSRGGYLRLAPHFCTSDDEVDQVVNALNEI